MFRKKQVSESKAQGKLCAPNITNILEDSHDTGREVDD